MAAAKGIDEGKEAEYYRPLQEGEVECQLCPKNCRIGPGEAGFCRVRRNEEGKLEAAGFGRVTSCSFDPVEKKPLYHFYPGHPVLSVGTYGCNFECQFCQNWRISQGSPRHALMTPAELVEIAQRERRDNIGIAYTYSEPMVWFEFVKETAEKARERGLKNVLVTNGFISPQPLEDLLPLIDAFNVDLKAFSSRFYTKYCRGMLEPVLDNISRIYRSGSHLEITTLLIAGLNDSCEELSSLLEFISGLSPAIPLHISRYFPNYQLDLPATPVERLREAWELARDKLHYPYVGNVHIKRAGDTWCPQCDNLLIKRTGYGMRAPGVTGENECDECGREVEVTGRIRRRF